MMKKILGIVVLVLMVGCSLAKAQNSEPFAELNNYVKTELGGNFSGDEKLVTLFNNERRQLVANFESELLKYLGKDVQKYYWISAYIQDKSYLQGNQSLPELSLRLKQKGLSLIETEDDKYAYEIGLNVTAAILSVELKKPDLAKSFKARVVKLTKENSVYEGSFPALDDGERAIYDAIDAK